MRDYNYEKMLDRLKKTINEKKLSLKKLASLANVPYGTLYKVFSGETKEPSINLIIKIASVLGITANYLILGDEKIITSESVLNETDEKILNIFHSINRQGQEYVMQTLDMVKDKYNKNNICKTKQNPQKKSPTFVVAARGGHYEIKKTEELEKAFEADLNYDDSNDEGLY